MSCLAVSSNFIAVSRDLRVDCFVNSNHSIFQVPETNSKFEDRDVISDISISHDCKYLAVITSVSKKLLIYNPTSGESQSFNLPRSASKVRFTANGSEVLIADKSGDALIYDLKRDASGTKLLGHLSLLLDILQTNDGKFIITSDRDEKIRVSCYPNTYNIQTYCLGHKEFVNHIEILPHNVECLTSTSGDGTVKCWHYQSGKLLYNLDTSLDIEDIKLKEKFVIEMSEDGLEVSTLPIVHFSVTQLNSTTSLLAVAIHSLNTILVYSLRGSDDNFKHQLEAKLKLPRFPDAIHLLNSKLYIFNREESILTTYKYADCEEITLELDENIKMFQNESFIENKADKSENIKMLYKRKFDNVQEYQERKKQRLEKSVK